MDIRGFAGSLGAFTAALCWQVSTASAQSAPPSITLVAAPLISPASARSAFGTATAHTDGAAARLGTAVEIVTLARSLGSEQLIAGQITQAQYIDNVISWVRNNVEIELKYGLSKGAVGALIDLHGTPFDQAELAVLLLRAGNVTANFEFGDVTMQGSQFGYWSGLARSITSEPSASSDPYQEFPLETFVVDASSACKLLADGGVPATANSQGSCDSLSGSLTSVTFSSVWVKVGSQTFDPSIKAHVLRAGIDLPSAMGCGTQAASTCGPSLVSTSGVTTGTQNGATTISTPDTLQPSANFNTNFNSKAQSLLSTIRSGGATREPVEIVGGRKLAPSAAAFSLMASGTTYAAATSGVTSSSNMPDQFRTTLTVAVPGNVGTCTFFGDELAGQRLFITGQSSGSIDIGVEGRSLHIGPIVHPCPGGGQTVAAGRILIAVNHPYAALSGAYADRTVEFSVVEPAPPGSRNFLIDGGSNMFASAGQIEGSTLGSFPWVIVHGFGDASSSAERHSTDLNTVRPLIQPIAGVPCTPHTTLTISTASCPFGNMALTAEQIRVRTTSYNKLAAGITKTTVTMHDQVGVVFSSRNASTKLISVSAAYSTNANSAADTTARQRAFELIAIGQPRIETASMDDAWHSDLQLRAVPTSSPTLMVPPSAMAAVLAAMPAPTALSAAEQAFEAQWRQRLQAAASAGYTVLMNNAWSLTGGEIFVKGNELSYTFWAGIKGGQIADPFKAAMSSVEISRDAKPRPDYSSISLSDGELSYSTPPDLVTGSGAFPHSLAFQRTYRGGASLNWTSNSFTYYLGQSPQTSSSTSLRYTGADQDVSSRIGGGWTHNFNVSAALSWDLGRALGEGSAAEAVPTIVSLVAMNDLANSVATTPTIINRINLASFQRLIFPIETALIRNGAGSESFSVLWDGQFQPQTSNGSKLTISSSYAGPGAAFPASLTYTSREGEVIYFGRLARLNYSPGPGCFAITGGPMTVAYGAADPVYLADYWTWPDGMRLDFVYEEQPLYNTLGTVDNCHSSRAQILRQVYNNVGRSLTFNYAAGSTLSVPFDNGYSIQQVNVPSSYVINSVQDESGRAVSFSRSGCNIDGGHICDAVSVTNPANETTTYRYAATTASPNPSVPMRTGYRIRSWSMPTAPSVDVETFAYDEFYRVKKSTDVNSSQTIIFAGGLLGSELYKPGRRRDSIGEALTLFDANGNAVRQADELGRITRFVYDGANRQIRQVLPEGNEVRKQYDIRSNVFEQRQIAKLSSPILPDIVTTTSYVGGQSQTPYQCANIVTCNKPLTDTDALGNVSNFAYDPTTGNLTQVLKPSVLVKPDNVSLRPQIDLGYTTLGGISFLTSKTEKIDNTRSVVTNYNYDSGNHYGLSSVVVDPSGLNLRTCLKYDAVGNLIASTQPKGATSACP